MRSYFKNLCTAQYLLWSYFIWYLTIITFHFDNDPEIWFSALGISIIIGIALVLSTTCWPIEIKKLNVRQTLRLFIIPFCVSSYATLIKGQGFTFIFPPEIKTSSIAVLAIIVFITFLFVAKKLAVKPEVR